VNAQSNLVRIPLKVDDLSIDKEVVLAEPRSAGRFVVRSIPAFVYGTAYGDEIEVMSESGRFEVRERGGHVTIRAFMSGTLDKAAVDGVIEQVSSLGGIHEIARNAKASDDASLLLISIPVAVGFPLIEQMMNRLAPLKVRWEYGNVYAPSGAPLMWWQ
jgi:hypothetical protein